MVRTEQNNAIRMELPLGQRTQFRRRKKEIERL